MPPDEAALASLSSLDDRVRGALYEFVAGRAEPVVQAAQRGQGGLVRGQDHSCTLSLEKIH